MAPERKQTFTISRAADGGFKADGLRSFFEYRDLGIAEATNGRFHAQIIRAREACGEGTGRHRHALDFQMVYILKGWADFTYEGQGAFTLQAGDSVLQPPGILHELTACSDDLEMIEVTAPAEFSTEPA